MGENSSIHLKTCSYKVAVDSILRYFKKIVMHQLEKFNRRYALYLKKMQAIGYLSRQTQYRALTKIVLKCDTKLTHQDTHHHQHLCLYLFVQHEPQAVAWMDFWMDF